MPQAARLALTLLLATAALPGCQARTPFQASAPQAAAPESSALRQLQGAEGGAFAVGSALVDGLKDPSRQNRELPLKAYFPQVATQACPVVIVSHGGQGKESSREAYAYLGRHLASQGFVAIHPQHREDAKRPLTHDRPLDVRFLLDQLSAQKVQLPGFSGRLNLQAIGMAGHSFGAYTTLALAGLKVDQPLRYGGENTRYADPRLKAFLALSPQGSGQYGVDGQAWARIQAPVYELMGQAELGVKGDAIPAPHPRWRLEAWEGLPRGDKHLAVLPQAQHSDFNDRRQPTEVSRRTQAFVQANATLFFRAYLEKQTQLKPLIGSLARPEGTVVAAK